MALLLLVQLFPASVLAAGVAAVQQWAAAPVPYREGEGLPGENDPGEGGLEAPPITPMNLVPCTGHIYCDEGCDPADCQCDSSCLCEATFTTCITPTACTTTECKCSQPGAEGFCICTADCPCMFPDFSATTTTTVGSEAASLPTGRQTTVDVSVNLSSSGAVFSNVVFKTYIESPLQVLPVNLDGSFEYLGQSTVTHTDGKTYTVISATTSVYSSAAGVYSLDVMYPAGVTESGVSANAFTVIEGTINDGTNPEMAFGQAQNDSIKTAQIVSYAQETTWALELENVALDYKDEKQNNVFRQRVSLSRTPAGVDGVYYLQKTGTDVVITLPGGTGDASLLRITRADGTAVTGLTIEGNTLTIPADKIPFTQGSFADGPSSAESAELYLVFELTDKYLASQTPVNVDGFLVYDGVNTTAAFDYTTTQKQGHSEKTVGVAIVDYQPGGGGGSMGKWPTQLYIDGKTFFDDDTSTMTPVQYVISYVNKANTPVDRLVITDKLPKLYNVSGGTVNQVLMDGLGNANSVPVGSVQFYTFTLTAFDETRLDSGSMDATLEFYKNGGLTGSATLALNTPTSIPAGTDEIRLVVGGILNPNFSLRGQVSLVGSDALAADKPNRDKIQFITNTAGYSAWSTKDTAVELKGSDSGTVHIYPFDNDPEPERIWQLQGYVATSAQGTTAEIRAYQGGGFYYRLRLHPNDSNQFVYKPVFLVQLPPEVQLYDEENIAANIGFTGTEGFAYTAKVIQNPAGAGRLLVVTAADKQLMNPNGDNYLTVHCRVHPNAPYGATVKSQVYFGVEDTLTPLSATGCAAQLLAAGSALYNNAAVTSTDKLLYSGVLTVNVPGSGKLEGELSVQTELGRETGLWYKHPETALALPGGLLTYRFDVRNGGELDAENLVLYNVFSTSGDHFIVSGSPRKSAWQPYLVGPVQLPAGLQGKATVYYSEYDDHRVYPDGTYVGEDDWTTEPYSYTSVKAIKIVFNTSDGKMGTPYVLKGSASNGGVGETITITVPMYAPNDYKVNEAAGANNSAISSLATQFNFEGKSQTMALEPLRVIVDLDNSLKGTIKGLVWGDANQNGTQDDLGSTEFVMANAEVQLYKEQSGSYVYQYATRTDDAGQYTFTNLNDGDYQVRVVLPTGYQAVSATGSHNSFTQSDTGSHPEEAGNPAYSYVYTANYTVAGKTLYENVDAAVYPAPTSISGMVWRSISGEAERDTLTANKDVFLGGVTVTLYRVISGDTRTQVGTSQTTSTVDGSYTFTNVPAGRYVVVFTLLPNYSFAQRADAPAQKGKPTLANFSQAATKAEKGEEKGQSYEIWLSPGTPQTQVNCGMKPALSTISGNVFNDKNGDMEKNTGDTNLAGIILQLTKTAGYADPAGSYALQATTDANGNYSFAGLTPGSYSVSYADTTASPYYVTRHRDTTVPENTPRAASHSFTGIEVEPRDGLARSGYSLGLCQKLVISGSVFNDKNSNQAYNDGTDAPLAVGGITVQRTAGSGGDGTQFLDNTVSAGADGAYSIAVWPGSYTVSFPIGAGLYADALAQTSDGTTDYNSYLVMTAEKTSGAKQFLRTARQYTLQNLVANATKVDLALVRPRSLAGTVWHDRDGDGLHGGSDAYFSAGRGLTIAAASGTNAVPGSTAATSNTTNGAFSFTGLYPGTYTVTVDKTGGYMVTNYTAKPEGTAPDYLSIDGVWQITIPAVDGGYAADPDDLNIGLALPVSFGGYVWRDMEALSAASDYAFNGSYDSGVDADYDLAGIAQLQRWNGTAYVPWKDGYYVSGAGQAAGTSGGQYRYTGLLPGNYRVVLTPSADYFVTGAATASAALPGGGTAGYSSSDAAGSWEDIVLYSGDSFDGTRAAGLNLSVGRYMVISGVIFHDVNGNGAKDAAPEGPYIATAPATQPAVQLQRHNGTTYASLGTPQATNSTTGAYSFKVKPGRYQVVFGQGSWRITNPATDTGLDVQAGDPAPENRTATWVNLDYVTATAQDITGRDYLVSLYAKIEGLVWQDVDASGAKDTGESPYAKVTLSLSNSDFTSSSHPLYSWWQGYGNKEITNSAADGSFAFEDLWPGTYYVTISGYTGTGGLGLSGYLRTNLATAANVTEISQWVWKIVVGSDTDNTVQYGLVKPSTFEADVYRDANNNLAKDTDPAEASIGSLRLVRTQADGTAIAVGSAMKTYDETKTLSGPVTFSDLLPGTYTLTVSGVNSSWIRTVLANTLAYGTGHGSVALTENGDAHTYKLVIQDTTGAGFTIEGAQIGFIAPCTIKGNVFLDADQNGTKDGGEGNVNGVQAVVERKLGSGYTTITQASTNGSFNVTGLLPGEYRITFTGVPATHLVTTADGAAAQPTGDAQATGSFAKSSCTWTVNITSDGKTVQLDTGIIQSVSIAGYVWKDLNANKSYGTGESYFQGRTVQLHRTDDSSGKIGADVVTSAGGAFSFTGLYPGTYKVVLVEETNDSWYPTNTGNNVLTNNWYLDGIVMTAGAAKTDANIGLTQLASVSGRVWEDKTLTGADGIFNENDIPQGGAVIAVAGTSGAASGYSTTVQTNSTTGVYQLEGLVPGTYTFTLQEDKNGNSFADMLNVNSVKSHTSGANTATLANGANVWTVVIHSGFAQQNCDFALSGSSLMRVLVWDDKDADGNPTPETGDTALADIAIKVYKYNPANTTQNDGYNIDVTPAGTQQTNALGQWSMEIKETGSYRVQVTVPTAGGFDAWQVMTASTNYVDVTVSGIGPVYEEPKFGMSKYIILSGRVWADPEYDAVYDTQDTPQNNHAVRIYKNGTGQPLVVYTGADGTYTTTAAHKLLPGSYTAVVDALQNHDVCTPGTAAFERATRTWSQSGLLSGAQVNGLDCAFGQGYKIEGELWEDVNATGSWLAGDGDVALGGVKMVLRRSAPLASGEGDIILEATSNPSTGEYSFPCVMPGDYTVQAVVTAADFSCNINCSELDIVFTGCIGDCPDCSTGHLESTFVRQRGLWTLHVGGDVSNVRSGVHVGSEIAGTLTREGTGAAVVGQEVELYIWDDVQNSFEYYDSITTAANGDYRFSHLRPGEYEVRVAIPQGHSIAAASEGVQQGEYIVLQNLQIAAMGSSQSNHVVVKPPPPGASPAGTGPQTGDDAPLELMVVVNLLSLAAMLVVGWQLRALGKRKAKAGLAAREMRIRHQLAGLNNRKKR